MFHKPFRIKSNTTTKNSERKRLKREIGSQFPDLYQHHLDALIPNKSAIATVKVVTHGGTNVTVTTVDKEPIMFESEGVLCPTVYTLWRYPAMLQSVTTWPAVIPKLQGGADLMLPGVVTGDQGGCGLEGIFKSQLLGVNTVKNRSVVGVGVALMSHDQMLANGMRGKGIEILHLYEDKLWEMGSKSDPPLIPMELPLKLETTAESQTTPTSTEKATPTPSLEATNEDEEPVKSKPIGQTTGPTKSSLAGVIQKVGGVRVKKGKKRKPHKSSEESGTKSTADKLKAKVSSKFSSRSHKRYRDHTINELAKTEVELTYSDGDGDTDEYDDEDLSSMDSEDEYLLSTVEDQSVAVGLMPDDTNDLMHFAEMYHPELVVMLKRTITLYIPIGEKPTNLPKKLNKKFVKSQKESLKDHGLVKQDESNVDTLQMHAQEVMKTDFEPGRGLSPDVIDILGERRKMIVYAPVFFKLGEPRPETDIANFAIEEESTEISSTLTTMFNATDESSFPSKDIVDPSLSVQEVAAKALKSAKTEDAVALPAKTETPPTKPPLPLPPSPEDLAPLKSKDPKFLERYCCYKPKSEGYRQAGLVAQKLTILDFETGEFELQPFRLQRKLRKKYGKKKRPKTPPQTSLTELTSKDFYDMPTMTAAELKEAQAQNYVKVTDIPCVYVDGEIVPLSQVLSDTDYNAEIKGNFTDVEKLVLRALKKIAVLGLVSEDAYSSEGEEVEPIDLVMEQISKQFRDRVKSGEGGKVINTQQFVELKERYTKDKKRKKTSNTSALVPGRNYDRSLMRFVTEPMKDTMTSSSEKMTSSSASSEVLPIPQLAVLSVTETVESSRTARITNKPPDSVIATPDVMKSSAKKVPSLPAADKATSLQKKAAAWASVGAGLEGDVAPPPGLLDDILKEESSKDEPVPKKSPSSPSKDVKTTSEPPKEVPAKEETKEEEVFSKTTAKPEEGKKSSPAIPQPVAAEGEKKSHDEAAKSHDEEKKTLDAAPKSHDEEKKSLDAAPKSHDKEKKSHDAAAKKSKKSRDRVKEKEGGASHDEVVRSKILKGIPQNSNDPTDILRAKYARGEPFLESDIAEIIRSKIHEGKTIYVEGDEYRDPSLLPSAPPDDPGISILRAPGMDAYVAVIPNFFPPSSDEEDEVEEVSESESESESDSQEVSSEPSLNWYPIPVPSEQGVETTNQTASKEASPAPPSPSMDDLLNECFYLALRSKVNKEEVPLLTSTFYRSHMMECCPSSFKLDVKKSSFKKLSKFLQEKQEEGVLKVEETAKGVESITSIEFKHPKVKSFVPQFVLPENEATPSSDTPTGSKSEASGYSGRMVIHIKELYVPSSTFLAIFRRYGYDRDAVLDEKQVREVLTSYVREMRLVSPDNPKEVGLDPLLADCLMGKGERDRLELSWHELMTKSLAKMKPAYSIAHGNGKPRIRKGTIQKVMITLTQRTSNKKVTIIDNLPLYLIDPHDIADKLQKIAAASTTVSKEPYSNYDSVIVQGNACKMAATLLEEEYGVPLKYMEAVNKLKPLKKKKSGRK